eukprot:Rmarinus@m.17667
MCCPFVGTHTLSPSLALSLFHYLKRILIRSFFRDIFCLSLPRISGHMFRLGSFGAKFCLITRRIRLECKIMSDIICQKLVELRKLVKDAKEGHNDSIATCVLCVNIVSFLRYIPLSLSFLDIPRSLSSPENTVRALPAVVCLRKTF